MKRTTCWRWCHIQCALWIPETFFRFADGNDIIDVLKIPQSRFNLTCYYCNKKNGACIRCCQHQCDRTYHVSCAIQNQVELFNNIICFFTNYNF